MFKMIEVKKKDETTFNVTVDGVNFKVDLDEAYYKKMTSGKISKEELIKRSFEFLLKNEPLDEILKTFNLEIIKNYFHDYEEKVKV